MKFFHLSDLHIGLKLYNRDLREDQEYIFRQIAEISRSEKPDAVVIAGDIYDKAVPSAEAVELFDLFINLLTEAVPSAHIMMISGNHDSAARVNLFRSILGISGIHMIGQPPIRQEDRIEKVSLSDEFGEVDFYLLPFVRPSMVRGLFGEELSYNEALHALISREGLSAEDSRRRVLVSHQLYLPIGEDPAKLERMDSEIRTMGDIDEVKADFLGLFDYAALGHIHKPMFVGNERYRYCGTPLACSVSEAGQQKGIITVEMGKKGEVKTSVIPLKPLRQVRKITGTLEEVLKLGSEDYVSVELTNKADLDVFDIPDRLRHAFPNLLEIRRSLDGKASEAAGIELSEEMDTFDICKAFLSDLIPEEEELLQDVINTVRGRASA